MGQLLRYNQASGPRSILTCLSSTSRQQLVVFFFLSSQIHVMLYEVHSHTLMVAEVPSFYILHIAKYFIIFQKVLISFVANAGDCNK